MLPPCESLGKAGNPAKAALPSRDVDHGRIISFTDPPGAHATADTTHNARGLLLLQLDAVFALNHNILLNLGHKSFSAAHLLKSSSRNVFLLSKVRLELQNFLIHVGGVAQRWTLSLDKILQALLGLLEAGLNISLFPEKVISLSGDLIHRRAKSTNL
ncbi:hypothetical protein HG530_002147 [Fusarium avenaceum]|nr:hypothetical protein HG530_002147 [Fusarium avenaceum]